MATKSVDPSQSLELTAGALGSWIPSGSVSDETLAGSRDGPERRLAQDDAVLPRGSTVGRYVVLGKLGAGAMGVVYTAHDPELDRKLALKLLRPRGSAQRIAAGHRRLLAEAQALARLSHPNVVGVHDVGEHAGHVFVAMELVEGRTLAAWLAEGRHAWPQVLDVLEQAGRGLAAAHARELVHRDFKPDNVMLGDDGRVRVMDFGLARAADPTVTDDSRESEILARSGAAWRAARGLEEAVAAPRRLGGQALTLGEGMVGTPAYAAPEQLAGGRGGAAADQFSFCVTLWEALHGRRPFVGDSLPEIAANILAGDMGDPPPGRRVPPWLRRIAERGLAVDPERRWPSMDALLAALARGRTRARRRWGVGAAGLVLVAAAGLVGWQYEAEQRRIRACEAEGAAIDEVWNADVAAALREAVVATGVSHADVTAQKLSPWLETRARAWQAARTQACLHAEVDGTWEADTHARSRWCLDQRRMELEALVGELRHAGPSSVAHAVPAAAGLEPLEPCTDALTLSRLPVPPTAQRDGIAAVRDELERADALQQIGDYDRGLVVARAALERAEALGWPPLVATARQRTGALLRHRGDYAEAEVALERAFFEAGRADAVDVAAAAARDLTYLVGDVLARPVEGLRWSSLHGLMLAHMPDPTGLRAADHAEIEGAVRQTMGEYETAKSRYEQALSLRERVLGPEHLDVANSIADLAIVYQDMGDHAQAKRLNERALVLVEQALGPAHPNVGNIVHNLARDERALGHPEQAKALYERALAGWEASLGPEHPHVAQVLNNLGNVSVDLGELEQAERLHERALALRERIYGPDHPQVAQSLDNLASLQQTLGARDGLVARYERALAIREKALGPEHPQVAFGLTNLGNALFMEERHEEARACFERALRIWDASVSPDHPHRVFSINGLALVALEQGRLAEASTLAEDGLRLRTANGASAIELAASRFTAAKVRWAAGGDRAQVVALAEQARDGFRAESQAQLARDVDVWLGSHLPGELDKNK